MTGADHLPRVCIVNLNLPPAYGGAEIAAYRYAERYRKAGGQVVVIGPATGLAGARDLPHWVKAIPGASDRNGSTIIDRIPGASVIRETTRVWPAIVGLRDSFDVLHIFNSAPLFNLGAVPPARLCGKPVVLEMSLRGSDDPLRLRQRTRPPIIPTPFPPLRYTLFRMADRFVAKSRALSAAFRQAGMPEEKLVRIPYGVDVHRYRPAPRDERRQIRAQLGLDESALLILFVGSLNPRKGVHWLIEAFASLPPDSPAHLLLLGPADKFPEYAASLRHAVAVTALESRVSFVTTGVTNVDQYMQASDVFVLPSVREGLPISVLEAMSSGLAVAASAIPEIADSQVQHGSEGLLFPIGDVPALASILARLIQNPEDRARLGAAARVRAETEFADTIVDQQYRKLYAEVMEKSGRWRE